MSRDDFDLYEKADFYLDFGNDPENLPKPDAADFHPEPITCPVVAWAVDHAETVGELSEALKLHRLEYCEDCGQLEGFVRPDRRKAA